MKVAVVGHCASGKTTVVKLLRADGYDAYSVAQEHSVIRDLWKHQEPQHVLYLDVSLDELRRRRGNPQWPAWIFEEQESRLLDARRNATVVINTDKHEPEDIVRIWQEKVEG